MRRCPQCQHELAADVRFCPFCGTASGEAAAPADPFVGRTVNGKFRIEALVGQGGMGRVYRARHLTLDRPVVLKMLHREWSGDPAIVQRFQREARAASRLNHPNSIAVLDFGEAEDGTLFMAMEYLAGRDLARVIAEDFPLGERRIADVGAQILSALAEAHAQGVVHRDLKPENVMVEPRREVRDFVKVLDFGIAKISVPGAGEPRLTQAGLVCGTPEYMSPEQARGDELDARSDLYSVGVILYQLATGELPFASDTPVGFLTKHLTEQPVPPRLRRPDLAISPALEAVIVRALEKDVAARFQTADEMRKALLAAAPTEPAFTIAPRSTVALPGTAGGPPPPPARRRAPLLAISGGALVAVVLGTMTALGVFRKPAPPAPPAQEETAIAPAPSTAPAAEPQGASPSPPAREETASTVGAGGEGRGEGGHEVQTAPAPPATGPVEPAGVTAPPPPAPKPAPARRKAPRAAESTAAAAAPAPVPGDYARALSLYHSAESRRADGDVDGAIALYLQAEQADPTLARVQKKLALSYQLKGDRRRARIHYERYLATDPEDADKVRAVLSTMR